MSENLPDDAAQRLIPGAYDRTTLTYRQPGSMGGGAFGAGDTPPGASSMDAATVAERDLEGGGGVTSTGGRFWFHLRRLVRR